MALYCLFNNQKIVSDPHKELERKVEKLKHMKLEVMQPKIKKSDNFLYVNLVNKPYRIGGRGGGAGLKEGVGSIKFFP